jgi:GDP-fucose transporter C1
MIIFNNLCLKYVEITFYQVARSLTIAFNVVFAFFVWNESTSRNCLIACFIVVFGYITGVDGEINFSWAGVIFGASSSCCLSLYSIFVKKYMKVLNDDSWLLLYYNNVNAMLVMPLISFAFGEYGISISQPNLLVISNLCSNVFLQSPSSRPPICGRLIRSGCWPLPAFWAL